jgi:hypothetical protein
VVTGQGDVSFLYGSMSGKIDIVTQKWSFSGRRLYSFETLCGIGLSTLAELEKGENDIRDEETPECHCHSHLICAFNVNRRIQFQATCSWGKICLSQETFPNYFICLPTGRNFSILYG